MKLIQSRRMRAERAAAMIGLAPLSMPAPWNVSSVPKVKGSSAQWQARNGLSCGV